MTGRAPFIDEQLMSRVKGSGGWSCRGQWRCRGLGLDTP